MPATPEPLDYLPHLPAKRDYGIGVIGAGSIARAGHLPAYRSAGFNVVGRLRRRHDQGGVVGRGL